MKNLVEYWRQAHRLLNAEGDYTIMLVPHDGSGISKREMRTAQVKRNFRIAVGMLAGLLGTLGVTSYLLYLSTQEANELAAYRSVKAQQEQKLQELAQNTQEVQRKLAALAKIELQVREQMEKSGMELPDKIQLGGDAGGKGGPAKEKISDMLILQQQNVTLQKELQARTQDWDNLLVSIKNENYRKEVTPDLWPLDGGYVSSEFGGRVNPFDGYSKDYHPGIDIADNYGAPVYASASGYVQRAGWYGGYGKYVKISHDYGYATAYGHMSGLEVNAGDYVSKGQIIGYIGSTGYSTGPHLHFELLLNERQVNPRRFMK